MAGENFMEKLLMVKHARWSGDAMVRVGDSQSLDCGFGSQPGIVSVY